MCFLTAIVGGLLLWAVANASQVSCKLSGSSYVIGSTVSQVDDFDYLDPGTPTSGSVNPASISTINDFSFSIDAKKNEHLSYGGNISINANTSESPVGELGLGRKASVYVQDNRYGRLEVGNMIGAGGYIQDLVHGFHSATGGFDGIWPLYLNAKTAKEYPVFGNPMTLPYTMALTFVISPNMLSNITSNYYSDAPKISYYAIPMDGVLIGLTYIQDLDSTGSIGSVATPSGPFPLTGRGGIPPSFEKIVQGGIRYEKDISKNFSVELGLVGESGKSKAPLINDLKAYEIASSFKVADKYVVKLAYGDWFDTATLKNATGVKQAANYLLTGVGVVGDALKYSLSYMYSRKAGGMESVGAKLGNLTDYSDTEYNTVKAFLFDLEYKWYDGLTPFVSVTKFNFKQPSAATANKGTLFLSGIKFSF